MCGDSIRSRGRRSTSAQHEPLPIERRAGEQDPLRPLRHLPDHPRTSDDAGLCSDDSARTCETRRHGRVNHVSPQLDWEILRSSPRWTSS